MRVKSDLLFYSSCLLVAFTSGCSRSAPYYVENGNKFLAAHNYEDASLQYRKAIQKDPNFGEAWFRLGLLEIDRNRGFDAYGPLSRAVQLMPASDEAKKKLGELSLALYIGLPQHPNELYTQVEKLADQLLAKNPASFDGLRLKGSLRLLDRKPKEAIAYFEKANQIDPMRPELIEGWVQALFQDNRVSDAEKLGMQVIDKNKAFGAMYDVLYKQYVAQNRQADAESILKLKVANNPKDARAVLQLAGFYASAKKLAEMNASLQRLLSAPQDFPDARLRVGDFYAGVGQPEDALRQFREGAQANPKQLVYRKRITDVLLAQGKRDEAQRMIEEILKDAPKDEDARRVKATLLLETGGRENVDVAVTELKDLASAKTDDVRLKSLLARAYLAQGNRDGAIEEYQRVASLRKDDRPSRLALMALNSEQHRPEEALRYADELLSLNSGDAVARLLRANVLISSGRYGEAHTELTRMLTQYPKSQEIQFQFGLLAIAEKKYAEAERIFRNLNQPGPEDARVSAALVETYAAQNQFDRAIEGLKADLKKTPESMALRRLLALTALRARKFDLAVAEYEHLLEKDSKSVELRLQLAQAYHLKGDMTTAINVLDQARQFAPKDVAPLMALAAMQTRAGRHAEAQQNLRRVLDLQPDNPFVLNNIAFVTAESGGNLDEALRLQQRALQKAPGNPVLTDTLGVIYLKKGMKDSAIQTLSGVVRQQPQNPEYRYHLALALLANRENQKAKSELETALSSQPPPELASKISTLLKGTAN